MTRVSQTHVPGQGEVILGVDTHKDFHAAVVITAVGVVCDGRMFPATADGYRGLICWAQHLGTLHRAGVEGTGAYGAALARELSSAGVQVFEVNRPDRTMRRRRGKTDLVDAEAAARAVLSGDATARPKAGDGVVEGMRVLKIAKDSAMKARVQAINQLRAIIINADPQLREELTALSRAALIKQCALLDTSGDMVSAVTAHTLRQLARRVQYLNGEIRDLQQRLTAMVNASAPDLLAVPGIGPDSAAVLLIAAGDNPDRLRSEASFAALCGVSPVQASSGKIQRHRLNRGGDRQANAALFRAVLTGLRWNQRTRDYMARRTTEGLSKLEIMRCLKRYMARTIYRIIRDAIPAPALDNP
jgi:transposase